MRKTFNVLRTIFAVALLTAFGGTVNAQIWSEDFNTTTYGNIPAGWTLGDGGNMVHSALPTTPDTTWCVTDAASGQGNDAGNDLGDANYIFIDSDNAGGSGTQQDTITSPVIDLSGQAVVVFKFDTYYRDGFGSTAKVEVYDANTSSWVTLADYTGTTLGSWATPAQMSYDVSAYISANFQFRFVYSGSFSWYWAIDRVYLADTANDVGVTAINLPNLNPCSPSATQTVEVTIQNFGSNSQSNFPVSYVLYTNGTPGTPVTETFAGPLAPGATATYTFTQTVDMSAPASYQIKAYTGLTGDGDNANDTTSRNIDVVVNAPTPTTPWVEGFESFTPPTTLANGWTREGGVYEWRVQTGATGSPNTGPSGAFEGNQYMYTEASAPAAPGDTASLISPCIDLSALSAPSLAFAYHFYGADIDRMYIDVSTDGGTTWSTQDSIVGQQQTADTDPWAVKEVPLFSYAGQVIKVRFRGIRGNDFQGDMAIDSVTVYETPAADVGVTAATLPNVNVCSPSATQTVEIVIKNYGAASQSNIPVSYVLYTNGTPGTPVTETFAGPLAPGATATYTFTQTVDISAPASYQVKAYTGLTGDANNSNDTTMSNSVTIFAKAMPTNTTPWVEGFESFTAPTTTANGWTITPTTGYRWQVGTGATPSSNTGPSGALEGNQYMFTEASPGNQGDVASLISPCIDLSGVTNPQLSFAYHFYGATIDRMYVDVSTDGGSTWTTLDSIVGQQQTATTDPWLVDTVALTSYAGQTIKIRFRGIEGSSFTGDMAIDSVSVWNMMANGVDIVGIGFNNTPTSVCPGETFNISGVFTNNGTDTAFSVKYVFMSDTLATDTLLAGANDTVTFSNVSYTNPGTYTIKVFSIAAGDNNAANDTITQTIVVKPLPMFTLSGPTTGVKNTTYCFNTGSVTADSIVWTLPAEATVDSSSGDTLRCVSFSKDSTYNVIATAYSNGCMYSDTVTITISTPTGIIGLNNQIRVYPNPVNDILNVSFAAGTAQATLYDLRGNKLYEGTIVNETSIDMSQFSKGIYILRINANGEVLNIKVVKQ